MARPYTLTPQQTRILTLNSEGHTKTDILRILHIAPSTYVTHLHNIRVQLNVRSLASAIAVAISLQLIDLSSIRPIPRNPHLPFPPRP